MRSSNGNFFRVTGPLWGESLTTASNAELWCFLWSCAWTNGWDVGDLRRRRAHYDVSVMGRPINHLYDFVYGTQPRGVEGTHYQKCHQEESKINDVAYVQLIFVNFTNKTITNVIRMTYHAAPMKPTNTNGGWFVGNNEYSAQSLTLNKLPSRLCTHAHFLYNVARRSTHCGQPDGTKPLPEPTLTYHQWRLVVINRGQFHWKRYR